MEDRAWEMRDDIRTVKTLVEFFVVDAAKLSVRKFDRLETLKALLVVWLSFSTLYGQYLCFPFLAILFP